MDDIIDITARLEERAARGDREAQLAKMRYLSQESETAPFLLFLMGDTIEQIASKTQYPKEVLAVTAKQYGWIARKEGFAREGRSVPAEMQRDLVNTILATTYIAIQQELSLVIRGERDASQCKFIPKSVTGLQTLIQMVNTVNEIKAPAKPGPTNITGDKVQVNITMPEPAMTREEMLKALSESDEKDKP